MQRCKSVLCSINLEVDFLDCGINTSPDVLSVSLKGFYQLTLPDAVYGGFVILFCGSAMAPHSSPLAWKIPWTEEPGGLQSRGSLGVRHDRATSLSLFPFMHWRRKWQPTPVFLPGESQGWESLVGCRPLGRTESDTTEAT